MLRHGCSPVNLLHIFRTPFRKNNYGGLLLITLFPNFVAFLELIYLSVSVRFTAQHCVKSVRIRSYSGPNAGKYGPE